MNRTRHDVGDSQSYAVAISHTPWVPERVESMQRLRRELAAAGLSHSCEFSERATNDVWSEDMWSWGVSQPDDWCVFLQDDAIIAPNFFRALDALIEAIEDRSMFEMSPDVIGLESVHPATVELCRADVRLCTTSDGLIGVGYVVRRTALVEFLRWRSTSLQPGWRDPGPGFLSEDTMLGLWCLVTGRRIVHPIPTLIDHDTAIASTYGNDAHPSRRPLVRWDSAVEFGHAWEVGDLEIPRFWKGHLRRVPIVDEHGAQRGSQFAESFAPEPPRHLGRLYASSPDMVRMHVMGLAEACHERIKRDNGDRELRRLSYQARARVGATPKARVMVCTPTRGLVHPEYASTLWSTIRATEIELVDTVEVLDAHQWSDDLVRVRSRFLRAALDSDCTHVWFLDADVRADTEALMGMLRSEHPIVITPYPARGGIRWERLRDSPNPELLAYSYKLAIKPQSTLDARGCIEILCGPLGCAVIARETIERMVAHYDALDRARVDIEALRVGGGDPSAALDELERWRAGNMGLRFTDYVAGHTHQTVALFQLAVRRDGDGALCSEDVAFCGRARDMGIPVHAYFGPGSPADHVGEHVYRGQLGAFGLRRA